jgi:hypothetical protein
VIFKILTYEWNLATLFGVLILGFFVFMSVIMIPPFLILLHHLWIESRRKVFYYKRENFLIIDDHTIELNSDQVKIIVYEQVGLLGNKVSHRLTGLVNKKIEIALNGKIYPVSKILYFPESLRNQIADHKNVTVVKKMHIWM